MYIARVKGNVVATIKHPFLSGRKLMLVEQLDLEGLGTGAYDIAIDDVQAGVGDTVLIVDEGNGARQILHGNNAPVRAVIAGIIDQVMIGSA